MLNLIEASNAQDIFPIPSEQKAINLLLEKSQPIKTTEKTNYYECIFSEESLLLNAIERSYLTMVRVLLILGAAATLRIRDKKDAIAFALDNDHPDIAEDIRIFIETKKKQLKFPQILNDCVTKSAGISCAVSL